MTSDSPTEFESAKERWHRAVQYAESVKYGKASEYALARAESERLASEALKLMKEAGALV